MMSAALGVLLTAHVSQDPMFSLTLRADGVLGARAWRLRREIEVNLIEIGCCPLEPSNRAEPPRRGDEAMRQMRFVSPIVRMRIVATVDHRRRIASVRRCRRQLCAVCNL